MKKALHFLVGPAQWRVHAAKFDPLGGFVEEAMLAAFTRMNWMQLVVDC